MKKGFLLICLVFSLCCCVQKREFISYKPARFERLIQKEATIQLIDVRRLDEYAAGHIDRAVLINVQDSGFVAKADSLLDKSQPVAVYCKGGKRSKEAAGKLTKEGYKVYELDNGYSGWLEYEKIKDNNSK